MKAKAGSCRLSLLTAYRARPAHLKILLDWLARARHQEGFADFELVLVEGDVCPTAPKECGCPEWARFVFVEMPDLFNKALLLNRAASVAQGAFFMPLDVDLLPGKGVLHQHV